jgi:hypothetical protein
VNTAANIAQDAINGENIKEAAKAHVTSATHDIFAKAPLALREALNKKPPTKRKAVGKLTPGKLVASARKKKKANSYNFEEYPALRKLL